MTKEQDRVPTNFWLRLLMVGLATFLFLPMLYFIDYVCLNNRYTNWVAYKRDCRFNIPPGYIIVYSPSKKMYAVQVGSDKFLCNGRYGITAYYNSTSEPSLFWDTCHAKAYLKAYLQQQEPKINDFK